MAPTSSQVKAAAWKGEGLGTTQNADSIVAFDGTVATPQSGNVATTFALKQTSRKNTPLKKTPREKLKELDVSITISVDNVDISTDLLGKMEEFIEKECISGLCSIEKGAAAPLSRLHLQMVCRLLASSTAMISKCVKTYLGWDDGHVAPTGHRVRTKTLCNVGLHTFIGMLGYCMKENGEEHFHCVHRNVTDEQINEGVEEYVKHACPFAKNKTILTHTNLLDRAATYYKYKMEKHSGSSLPDTLLLMLQSEQYIPSASWVWPARQGGMECTGASLLWKCVMTPSAIEMDDVTRIFFQHTNPGAVPKDTDHDCNNGIIINGTQEAVHTPADLPIKQYSCR